MDPMTDLLSTQEVISCRIHFTREVPREAGSDVIKKFSEPEPSYAVKEPMPVEQLLKNENKANAPEEFHFLFLPDALSAMDLPKEESAIELFAKPNKIIWQPHRTVVSGGQNLPEEMFMALVEFAFLEGALRKLESKLNGYFGVCSNDIPLTHAVDSSGLRRQAHVNEMTRQVTSSRMEFVRLVPCFDHLYARLAPHAKQVIGELAKKTGVWNDRVEAVDDQLEFLEDVYERANDRLTEFRYFKRESTLELWIIALLVLEVAVMLWETLALSFHPS